MSKVVAEIEDDEEGARDELRFRILTAAMKLLTEEGRDAVTTRAVAEAAGVQPPILYRQFRDKSGLLEALCAYGFAEYLAQKKLSRLPSDPIEAMKIGWDRHVEFGLSHPALYLLMYAEPKPGQKSSGATASFQMLRTHIGHIAVAGRLRVKEERAANLVHAAACGTVLTLLSMNEEDRDMKVSKLACQAILNAIISDAPAQSESGVAAAAITLKALLNENTPLSSSERNLLTDWLGRLAES